MIPTLTKKECSNCKGRGQVSGVGDMQTCCVCNGTGLAREPKQPTKKKWCGHIKWKEYGTGLDKFHLKPCLVSFEVFKHAWFLKDELVPRSWTRCPICGKERPKG